MPGHDGAAATRPAPDGTTITPASKPPRHLTPPEESRQPHVTNRDCSTGESAQMGSRSSRFMSLPRQSHIETAIWPYSRLVSRDGAHHQCLCGHPYVAHQHYRSGSECSFCSDCTRYRTGRVGIVRIVALLTNALKSRSGPPASSLTQAIARRADVRHYLVEAMTQNIL